MIDLIATVQNPLVQNLKVPIVHTIKRRFDPVSLCRLIEFNPVKFDSSLQVRSFNSPILFLLYMAKRREVDSSERFHQLRRLVTVLIVLAAEDTAVYM